jgi:hypothetical protein
MTAPVFKAKCALLSRGSKLSRPFACLEHDQVSAGQNLKWAANFLHVVELG